MVLATVPSGRYKFYQNARRVILALLILAALLQIAGFVTPGWVVTDVENGGVEHSLDRGLWYFVYCRNDDCVTKSFTELDNYPHYKLSDDDLLEYQIEATIALACVLGALVFFALAWCTDRFFRRMLCLLTMALLALVSGVLALLAVGRLADETIDMDDRFGKNSPFDVPYSLILTGLGGILCAIVFFIYLFILCCCRPVGSEAKYVKRKGGAIVTEVVPPYPLSVNPIHEKVIVTENQFVEPVPQEKVIITNDRFVSPPPQEKVIVTNNRYVSPPPQEKVIITESVRQPTVHHYSSRRQYEHVVAPQEPRKVFEYEPIHVKLQVLKPGERLPDNIVRTNSGGSRVVLY